MAEGRGLGGGGGGRGLGSGSSGGRGINRKPTKKKDEGFSILRAALTPAEWLINQVSRPAYSVGSIVAGSPANALREMAAFTTLGASELLPGMDAPETTVSQALQGRGVNFGSGVPGFLLRFGTDIVTDPASYVTFGTAGAVRGAASAAGKKAIEKATAETAAEGVTGTARVARIRAAERGARTGAKRAAPRQFAVNVAPLGVTLARRGKPIASRDIVLQNSAIGRQLDKALDAMGSTRAVRATNRIFATGGDAAVDNRVVDSMVQAIRQQADQVKNVRLARVLRRQEAEFARTIKEAGVDREAARRSVGAYLLSRNDFSNGLGASHAAAYSNYVRNAAEAGVKNDYLDFATVERLLGDQVKFFDSVAGSTGRSEVKNGVKTTDDLIENYVPRIARRGKDQRKVSKVEGWNTPTTALRSSTTQQARKLRTSDEWFQLGLLPEDDFMRLAQWRMNQSVDLIAQQQALNAVSARYGRVLDEEEILKKLRSRQTKAGEKLFAAANMVGKSREAKANADAEVVQRALQVSDEKSAIQKIKAGDEQAIGRAQGDVDMVRGVQGENPLPTNAQAGAAAAARAEGPSFADLQSIAAEQFDARQFLQMARNELARRRAEVDAGLERASVLGPYQRLVVKAEQAVKSTRVSRDRLTALEATALRDEAINLLRGERAARRADVKKAQAALTKARRGRNKAAIARAQGRVREAKLRQRIAEQRAERARIPVERARRRFEERARIFADRSDDLAAGEAAAQRTLKTPGQRASAKEFAEYKAQGWQQLQYDYDSVVSLVSPEVRGYVDDAFRKAWEITTDQGAFAGVKQFVNSATSRWKGLALISVGYHMRNLQSDLMMAWIAGAKDPRSIVQAVQMIRGRSGSIVINGEKVSYADMVREAAQNGTIRSGEVAADAGRIAQQAERTGRGGVIGPPRVPGEGSVAQGSYRFGRFREDSTRLMLYIERRKAGDTAEEAAEVVRNYLFDYGDTSRFVASTRRFLLPFITWSAKALPRMVKQAVETPRTFTRIGFLTDAANESFGPIDVNTLPMGRTLSFAIPTFGLGSGTFTYNPESVLPYGVLNSFNPFGFRQMGRSAGMFLNPAVRAPIELATNYNLYQGRTAPRRVQAPVWIRALSGAGVSGTPLDIGPKQDLYTKQEVTGYSRAYDTLFRMFPPYGLAQNYPGVGTESDRIGYLRSIFGVNVSPYERQRDLFYAQRFAPRS